MPSYDVVPIATPIRRQASAPVLMFEASTPLFELALLAHDAEATIELGDGAADLLVLELRDVLDMSLATGLVLRRALEAHGRDVGYVTHVWHRRAAELTGEIVDDHAGTFPAEIAAEAGLHLSLALEAARRDQIAVPGHLAAATGRVDAMRALASARLRDHRG